MSSDEALGSREKHTALRILWGQIRRTNRDAEDDDKVKFLKKIPFFESLRKNQLELVAQYVHERNHYEGEYIFEMGQPGAALFIVQKGEVSVEISATETTSATQLAVLGKYSFFGELALLDESARSASARAKVNTRVLALFRKDLDRLAEDHPDITSRIYKTLATIVGNRLKATNDLIEKRLKAVA